jgi:hypothetical protein
MTIRFLETFNLYPDTSNGAIGNNNLLRRWDAVNETFGLGNLHNTNGRWGGRCLIITGVGQAIKAFPVGGDSPSNRHFTSFALHVIGLPISMSTALPVVWGDGAGNWHLGLRVGTDGALNLHRVTSQNGVNSNASALASSAAGLFTSGTWYRTEVGIYMHGTSGTVQVRVDDELVIDFTGNTMSSDGSGHQTNVGRLRVQGTALGGAASTGGHAFQDILIYDESGDGPSGFVGDFVVPVGGLRPNANGNNIDGTTEGAANAWDAVNDPLFPANPNADYQQLNDPDDFDLFQKPSISANSIIAVYAASLVRATGNEPRQMQFAARSGGTNYFDGEDKAVPGQITHVLRDHFWQVDPDTTDPWLVADFNAAEFGYKRTD